MKPSFKILCLLLAAAMLLPLCACTSATIPTGGDPTQPSQPSNNVQPPKRSHDLMAGVTRNPVQSAEIPEALYASVTDFSFALLRNAYQEGKNTVLSPESILTALALVANGANGQTLSQLEQALGASIDELNNWFAARDPGQELVSANAIWMKEDLPVHQTFLQKNADYFGASAYTAAMDEKTLADINDWVAKNTKDRIKKLLGRLDADTRMVLVNALTFDGEWANPYTKSDLRDGIFHAPGGDQKVTMMLSEERGYLSDDKATGFIKNYSGGRYAYAALLPNEGVSVQDYLASLTGEGFLKMLENAGSTRVLATMPKYKTECDFELTRVLQTMGVSDLFCDLADLSGISSEHLYVSSIVHKTFLEVDELGTRAGAATGVMVDGATAVPEDPKIVNLDRPFVMVIYDRQTNAIVFCGVINSVA